MVRWRNYYKLRRSWVFQIYAPRILVLTNRFVRLANNAGEESLMCEEKQKKKVRQNGLNSCRRWYLSRPKTIRSHIQKKNETARKRRIEYGVDVVKLGEPNGSMHEWYACLVHPILRRHCDCYSADGTRYHFSRTKCSTMLTVSIWSFSRNGANRLALVIGYLLCFWVSVRAKRVLREELSLIFGLLCGEDF